MDRLSQGEMGRRPPLTAKKCPNRLVLVTLPVEPPANEPAAPSPGAPDLETLHERQQALEIALVLLACRDPRLDNLIDILESMRKLAARSNPPRRGQVDAFDGILGTLRTVRDARAHSSHG